MTAAAVEYDALRDKTYRRARLGPDVAAFLAWLELGGASPITVDNYERALAVVCRMYPLTPIDQITDGQLAQVFKRFPAKSRRVRVAPYRTFFKWAVLSHRIDRGANPMELLPVIRRRPRVKPKLFSEAEVETLLSLPVIDAAPMAVLFDGMLRNAEARALTMRRCKPGSGWINVIDGKGGKDRRVRQSNRLAPLLADLELLEGLGPDDHIFYGIRANGSGARRVMRQQPIGEGTMSRWFHRCLADAGIQADGRTPHTCRHTGATHLRRRGYSADDLAIMLGHEDPRTTSVMYVQITPEEAAERWEEIEAREAGLVS